MQKTYAEEVARNAETLAGRIAALPETGARRRLAAIAGAPASGKSTLAEEVVARLVAAGVNAVLMPMDGFHLDNRLLEPMGLLPRKGAPETFDFGGFRATLARVQTEAQVFLPVFDRSREIAIAGAGEISAETTHVVVEGNYLLFDEDPWRELAPMWDFSAFLEVDEAELESRLLRRWNRFGYPPEEVRAKAFGNDIPNARRVAGAVVAPDMLLRQQKR
ncbi:MAG: nucleoside/nucleotide kinase family protein [Rhodobacterales bacterium]|nr:MAG: nucleoside/nucleotide kinase family protein [Rhodobacterales bacterium]